MGPASSAFPVKDTNRKVMCLGGQEGKSLTHLPNWSGLWSCILHALVPTTLTQGIPRVLWCWLLWCSHTAHQPLGYPSEGGYRQDPQGWEVSLRGIFCPKLCSSTKEDPNLALPSPVRAAWAVLGCTMGSCSPAYPAAVATSSFPLTSCTAPWPCKAHEPLLVILDRWLTHSTLHCLVNPQTTKSWCVQGEQRQQHLCALSSYRCTVPYRS